MIIKNRLLTTKEMCDLLKMMNRDNRNLDLPVMLTSEELAELLGISRARVYTLCSTQELPFIKISSRRIRFSVGDVEDWLRERGWRGG